MMTKLYNHVLYYLTAGFAVEIQGHESPWTDGAAGDVVLLALSDIKHRASSSSTGHKYRHRRISQDARQS